MKQFQEILKEKRDYYGNTEAAIEFAAEEYSAQCIKEKINKPELNNFIEGFKIEAVHQVERWGLEQEEKKPPHHYIMVLAKLMGKLAVAIWDKDADKFKHHCITIAASLFNCHRQIDKPGTEVHNWFKCAKEGCNNHVHDDECKFCEEHCDRNPYPDDED